MKYFLLFLLLLPLATASITYDGIQTAYNLGDALSAQVTFSPDEEVDGFVDITILCEEAIPYYRIPVALSPGETHTADLSQATVGRVQGECVLQGKVEQSDGTIVEEQESQSFTVTDGLSFTFSLPEDPTVPFQQTLLISPTYKKTPEVALSSSWAVSPTVVGKETTLSFTPPESAGTELFTLSGEDQFGNTFLFEEEVLFPSVPTSLSLSLEKTTFLPGEQLLVLTRVYNQEGEEMDVIPTLTFNGEDIVLPYTLPSLAPGNYPLAASLEELREETSVTISSLHNPEAMIEEQQFILTNKGNVPLDGSFSLFLEGKKTFFHEEKITLSPNERYELSLTVPEGTYELTASFQREPFHTTSLILEDERTLFTKLSHLVSGIFPGPIPLQGTPVKLIFACIVLFLFFYLYYMHTVHSGALSLLGKTVKKQRKKETHLKDQVQKGKKQQAHLKNILNKHLGTSLTKELVEKKNLRGEEREVTVLFADIRGFSRLSQDEDTWFVVNVLNMYFERMSQSIKKHKGVVNKFIGDAVMALFNVPEQENHVLAAVDAALEMKKQLVMLNKRLENKGKNPIVMGVGIHTGKVILGTIGAKDRLEYTAIGDTVNTASRIQGLGRNQVIITKEVLDIIKEKVEYRQLGLAELKNFKERVRIYEVTKRKRP